MPVSWVLGRMGISDGVFETQFRLIAVKMCRKGGYFRIYLEILLFILFPSQRDCIDEIDSLPVIVSFFSRRYNIQRIRNV